MDLGLFQCVSSGLLFRRHSHLMFVRSFTPIPFFHHDWASVYSAIEPIWTLCAVINSSTRRRLEVDYNQHPFEPDLSLGLTDAKTRTPYVVGHCQSPPRSITGSSLIIPLIQNTRTPPYKTRLHQYMYYNSYASDTDYLELLIPYLPYDIIPIDFHPPLPISCTTDDLYLPSTSPLEVVRSSASSYFVGADFGWFGNQLDAEDWATSVRRRSRAMRTLTPTPMISPSLAGARQSSRLPTSTLSDMAAQANSTLPCAMEAACVLRSTQRSRRSYASMLRRMGMFL
ncbi:hypothetical protein BDN70DRAFT_935998 [Pholiota conissans]|uniref:Uncharacterized protein n=1 Tax=Pholiota conissans TaxID=109636 RepID=A0A9P5YT17_9AGAR|nr:hypothetical protein BDN70DRAFT_935998 [Pholiota conissans]